MSVGEVWREPGYWRAVEVIVRIEFLLRGGDRPGTGTAAIGCIFASGCPVPSSLIAFGTRAFVLHARAPTNSDTGG